MYPDYDFNNTNIPGVQMENAPAPFHSETGHSPAPPKSPGKWFAVRAIAAFLCCALIGGAAGAGGALLAGWASQEPAGASTTVYEGTRPTAVNTAVVNGKTILSATEIYNSNLPAVVGINGSVTTNVWGQTVRNAVSGSGFVISSDGYIITNYHVVDGVSDITVFFSNGDSYDAIVVGGEEDNDIAVLKIDAKGLQPVVLGDSDAIQIGENVYAVGNPLGELTFTLTGGYVSAKDREITMSSGTVMNMIQTDAAINSGNSGGPLFDQYGQVVGIVSAKLSNSSSSSSSVEGLGFAIPLNDVKDMVSSIIQNGYVAGKPNLGVIMEDSSAVSAWLQNGTVKGCRVLAVLEGSCSDSAGLQAGDVITKAGEAEVTSASSLSAAIKARKAGETLRLTVARSGQNLTLTVTLDEATRQRQTDMDALQTKYKASLPTIPYYNSFPYGN